MTCSKLGKGNLFKSNAIFAVLKLSYLKRIQSPSLHMLFNIPTFDLKYKSLYRLLILFEVMMLSRLVPAFRFSRMSYQSTNMRRCMVTSLSMMTDAPHGQSEIAFYSGSSDDVRAALLLLSAKRPLMEVSYDAMGSGSDTASKREDTDSVVWSAHSNNLQVDCTLLEPMFLGSSKLSSEETALKWDTMLSQRSSLLDDYSRDDLANCKHLVC